MCDFKYSDFKEYELIKADAEPNRYLICRIRRIDSFEEKVMSDILYSSFKTSAIECSFDFKDDYFQIIHNFGNISFEELKEQYPEEFI